MSVATTIAHRSSAPLLVAYALLALTGAVIDANDVRLGALCVLIAAVSMSLSGRAGLRGWGGWLAIVAVMAGLAARGWITLALDMVPILFNAAVCLLFARTLRRGHEPLVIRIIRVMEGEVRLDLPGVRVYARHVTMFWALLLGLQTAVLLLLWMTVAPGGLLAVLALHGPWAVDARHAVWYTHLGVYLLPLLGMLAEHSVRRLALRHMSHLSLPAFGRRLLQRWPQLLRETAAP